MAFEITVNDVDTIHDETDGLQNFTATPTPAGDANDNDIAVSQLPPDFSDRLIALGLDEGETGLTDDAIGAALSGYDGSNDGLNVFAVTINDSTVNNLALTDSEGNPLDGADSGLTTTAGDSIFLYTDPTNDNIVLGRTGTVNGENFTADPNGDIVFAIYLDENTDLTAGKLWTVQFEAIHHSDADDDDDVSNSLFEKLYVTAARDLEFDLTNAPSGQNLFIMFGDGDISAGDAEVGIIATGKNPANESNGESITTGDTVNTSQGGGNTTFGINNQMIDEGEGIYFTFVKGPESNYTVPNLDQNEADIEANIQFETFLGAKGAEFQVVQLQGGKTAVVTISAFNETESGDGVDFVDGLNNDAGVDISSVQVFESDGVTPATGVQVIDKGDGTYEIKGVEAGDIIQYSTDGDHNRVLIENAGTGKGKGSADFDIGGFTLVQGEVITSEFPLTVRWEDDGPDAVVANDTPDTLVLDESPVPDDGDGIASTTANFADNFTPAAGIDYGTDGAGSIAYSLSLSGDGIGSGLYALDPTDTAPAEGDGNDGDGIGQGAEILLYVNDAGTVVTGSTAATEGGIDAGNTHFTISVNNDDTSADFGKVTFTQTNNVWHSETADHDETSTLTLDGQDEYLQVVQTVTDGDGDTDSAELDLGAGVFKIEDDGPDAVVDNATADILVLDESDLPDPAEDPVVNDGVDDGIRIATANFADNFTPAAGIDYGTDGEGSIAYSLSLSADGIGSGLYALDPTDTAPAEGDGNDGDGIGQGAEILLYVNDAGTVVTGSTAATEGGIDAGNTHFTISVNNDDTSADFGKVTFTQTNNVWHSETADHDETSTLTTANSSDLQVVQSVTDADGDSDDAFINVGRGVFSIEDDGPDVEFGNLVGTVTTTTQTGEWSETVGTDGFGAVTIAAADSDGNPDNGIQFDMVTAGGVPSTGTIAFDSANGTGTLTADFDNDSTNGDETIGFDLIVNDDGTYDFTLDEVPLPVVTLSTDEGQLPAGGPDPVQTLTFGEGEDTTSFVFFAVDADTAEAGGAFGPANIVPAIFLGEDDLNEAQLEARAAAPLGNDLYGFIRQEIEMNVSTSGIGVNNNVLQGEDNPGDTAGTINAFGSGAFDESFVINPEPLASSVKVFISKTAGGFLPPVDDQGTLQGSAAKTDYLYVNVYDELGNSVGPILITSNMVTDEAAPGGTGENLWSFTIDIDDLGLAGNSIDAVQFTMGFGNIKIPKIEVVVRGNEPPNDIFLDFEATITDADGDSATNAFEVDLYAYDVISDTQLFDYTLADAGTGPDAFNAIDAAAQSRYLVEGFDADEDLLVLLNLVDGYTLDPATDGDGDGFADDSVITSDEGELEVVVKDATLTDADISSDTLIA